MGDPPESDREAVLGFDCLHRVAQSYLGPLWIAADVRDGSGTLGLLRRLALPDDTTDDARREIAALGRKAIALAHPNVLGVHEVLEQGVELIMVYAPAEAEPLRSLQSWANLRGLSFPVSVALRILVDLLRGLSATHELEQRTPGLSVSGGLSPDSVLVARDGTTRLCDPMIASGAALLDGVGFNTAKLAYSAPEQVHAATPPTPQTDLFTCAAMLWELLASRRLLAGSRPAIERKLLEHNLPSLRASLKAPTAVSAELVALVERTLAADPAARPQSATELAQLLGACGHEIAPLSEVAAFVGKLSGPRFDRRTAAIRSRSSGTLALDALELPRELPKSTRGRPPGTPPTSEIETPRTAGAPALERRGAVPSAPRPAPSAPNNVLPSLLAHAVPAHAVPVPPSAPRPAASALQAAALEASAQRAEKRAEREAAIDVEGLDEWVLESEPSSSPEVAPKTTATPQAAAAPATTPSTPFSPAPVEPPSPGFAPAPPPAPGRNPALWDQMVAPTTPPVTHKRAEAPLGMRTMSGVGGSSRPALAASLPFANLKPAPFAASNEAKAAVPTHSLPAPLEAGAPRGANDPFGVAALQAAAAPSADAPLPFEHLLRSKRGTSQRPSLEPSDQLSQRSQGSQTWFELHARPKSLAPKSRSGSIVSRPLFWVGLVVVLAAPVAWFATTRRDATSVMAANTERRPEPPGPTPAPEPPRSAIAPGPPGIPSAAPDAGVDEPAAAAPTDPPQPGVTAPADPPQLAAAAAPPGARPRPAGAADFTAAKLDDSQLVVLFALEERSTLPTCAERLGESVRKYSGNDMLRSSQQVKAARRKLAEGDAQAAHALACSAVAHSPRNPAAQRVLADIALQLGDPMQAKSAVDRALSQTPKDKGLIAMRGDVLAVMGDIAGSRSIWLSNAVAKGNKAARTKKLVGAYRKAGDKALASSNWADAAAYFRRAVVLTHGDFAPSLGLSEALLGLDHSSAALVWAERAAQAFPKDSRIRVLFGDALYESGQSEKARDAWQTALEVQPSNRLAARRLREGKP